MYDTLFFSDLVCSKISVYQYLSELPTGLHRLQDLIIQHELNFHQGTRVVREIEEDLKKANFYQQDLLVAGGKIQIQRGLPKADQFRAYLLKDSIAFQYILSIINDGKEDIVDFCMRMDISESKLSRNMRPLSKFIKQFDLRFTRTPINIVGEEFSIRHFLVHATWIGVQGNYWPFVRSIEQNAELAEAFCRCINNNNAGSSLAAIWGTNIFYTRYLQGHHFQIPDRFQEFIQDMPAYGRIVPQTQQYYQTLKNWRNETACWVLLSTMRHIRKRNIPFTHVLGLNMKMNSFHPIFRLADDIFDLFCQRHLVHEDIKEREELYNETVFEVFKLYCLSSNLCRPERFWKKKANIEKKNNIVTLLLEQFYDTQPSSILFFKQTISKEQFVQNFKCFYEECIREQTQLQTTIKIGISMEQSHFFKQRIMKELNKMEHVTIEHFKKHQVENYDLVIHASSVFTKKYPKTPNYFWGVTYGEAEILQLCAKAIELILSKRKVINKQVEKSKFA
ncbi:MAG: helix-turn-helix domain-containing protein [Streptococcaceae bacterium]|jgi:hypothetical protein|nr:helix-turn-helix domain-containing protein [Streptococcaceae bacterium]